MAIVILSYKNDKKRQPHYFKGSYKVLVGFIIAFGLLVMFNASRMYRATGTFLALTPDGLFDGNGQVLAAIDDIKKVDRGILAFKPSQGFLIVLNSRAKGGWAPGLWWRLGKQMGIGGVTSPAEGKYMAEQLQALLLERQNS